MTVVWGGVRGADEESIDCSCVCTVLLGKKTETETIEEALRQAIFVRQIAAGAERAFGFPWQDPYGEEQPMTPNAPIE